MQKHFRLPSDVLEIINGRDQTEYRSETAYVAAAIRKFSMTEEQKSILPELVQIQRQLNEIYRILTTREQPGMKLKDNQIVQEAKKNRKQEKDNHSFLGV